MKRYLNLQTVQIDKTLPKKILNILENSDWMKTHKEMHQNYEKAGVWICLLPWCIFRPNYGGNVKAVKQALNDLTDKEMKILEAKS